MSLSDEEQFDSLKSFAKKYGSAMISGILIALIAFFGWTYWQKKNLATSQVETAKVQQLMDEANASADNPNALSSVTASADKIVKDDIDSVQAIHCLLYTSQPSSMNCVSKSLMLHCTR
ncbi:hypothetical protein MWMV13_MWMV13_02695 [Acinetobacter oleivorans]|nr:hypothetical protein MWMV13_MWMV13_02695 [Acinetobacter oleivorans]